MPGPAPKKEEPKAATTKPCRFCMRSVDVEVIERRGVCPHCGELI